MEFQQGMTLVSSAAGALFGAGITWGALAARLKVVERDLLSNKADRLREFNEIRVEQDRAIQDIKERDIKEIRERHDRELESIKERVLWKGECDRCQDKWSSIVNGLRETMQHYADETNQKLEKIMERLGRIADAK